METQKKASVEELAEAKYPVMDKDGMSGLTYSMVHSYNSRQIEMRSAFIAGYNEAAKTLYTEEEVLAIIERVLDDDRLTVNGLIAPNEYLKNNI